MDSYDSHPFVLHEEQIRITFNFLEKSYGLTPKQCQGIMILNDTSIYALNETMRHDLIELCITDINFTKDLGITSSARWLACKINEEYLKKLRTRHEP